MNRSFYHAVLPVLLCIFLFLILPQTRIQQLFLKSVIPVKNPFTFISAGDSANSDKMISSSDPDVYPYAKNIAYTTTGALCIISEKRGSLYVLFPPPGDKTTTMLVDCYSVEDAQQRILIALPAQNSTIIFSDHSRLRNRTFNISDFLHPNQPFAIGFTSKVPTGKIVIEKLVVRQVSSTYSLPYMDLMVVFLILLFMLSRSIMDFYKNVFLLWFIVIITLCLFMIGLIFELRPLLSTWYWLLLLTTIIGFRQWKMNAPSYEWLTVIFSIGLIFRWNALLDTYGQTLGGDAIFYKKLATSINWAEPFSTGIREPLYIWLQAISLHVFGPNNYQFFFITVMLSLGIVYLTYKLARKASGSTVTGLIASLFVSFNYLTVLLSARGERMELFILLVLLYCLWTLLAKKNSMLSEVTIGLIAGCICLCWLFGIFGVLILYLLRIVFKRIKVTHALAGVLILAIVIGPFLLNQWHMYGDPFNALNVHANFYRNAELTGTPSYQQGPGTWYEYLLKEIGIHTLFYRTFTGYIRMLFNPWNPFNQTFIGFYPSPSYGYFLFPFYLLGLIRELYQRRFWILSMLFAFANLSPYLIDEYRDPRLLCFLTPFFAYFCGSGVDFILAGVGRLMSRKKGKQRKILKFRKYQP